MLGWIRKMFRIKGNVSLRKYHTGALRRLRIFFASASPSNDTVIDLLALRTQQSLRELKSRHYRIKLLLLNAKKVYSFLTGLLNKCCKMNNTQDFLECINEWDCCTEDSIKENYFFHSLIKPA